MRTKAISFCPTHPVSKPAKRLEQYMIDSSDVNNEMMFPSGR